MTLDEVLDRFPDAEPSGGSWKARCPAHDDGNPSLSITEGDDGRVLLHCHAGCEPLAVCRAAGITVSDLFAASTSTELPEAKEKRGNRRRSQSTEPTSYPTSEAALAALFKSMGRPADTQWTYHDASGLLVGIVCRWNLPNGRKTIRPVSRIGTEWQLAGMPEPRPLYRLTEIPDAGPVYVFEGEKTADAGWSIGLPSTASPHGSKSAAKCDWSKLQGREVVIVPDNDVPGRMYADQVAGILRSLSPQAVVRVVELPDVPEKGDLVDWLNDQEEDAKPEDLRAKVERLAAESAPLPENPKSGATLHYAPFPVRALPVPLARFVSEAAKSLGCDEAFVALPMLAVCAATIGNSTRIRMRPDWVAGHVLWCAIIGESGSSKTPAFQLVMKPLRQLQTKLLASHEEEMKEFQVRTDIYTKKYKHWQSNKKTSEDPPVRPEEPKAARLYVDDTTIEALASILKDNPRGTLSAVDELSGWFASFERYSNGKGGGDAPKWLSMFDGLELAVDRKSGLKTCTTIPSASVCVVGGIQPPVLQRSLGQQHRENGLAARLLMAYPPRRKRRWTETSISPEVSEKYSEIIEGLYELPFAESVESKLVPQILDISPEARQRFREYFEQHAEQEMELSGELLACWSKLIGYVGRLAMVLHLVRVVAHDESLADQTTVDLASMEWAIELVDWFKNEARRVYGMLSETPEESALRRLREWLVRKDRPVTAREVQQGCRWLNGPGEAEKALQALVDAGVGDWEHSPPGQPGQPTRRFVLKPVD